MTKHLLSSLSILFIKSYRIKNFIKSAFFIFLFLFSTSQAKSQKFGNAISYNSFQFLTLPNGIVSGVTSNFTIEGWVYWDATIPTGGPIPTFQRIFDFGNGTDSYVFLTPYDNSATPQMVFGIKLPGANPEIRINANSFPQNVMTHVAVTGDYTSNPSQPMGYLYVNGTLVGSGNLYNGSTNYFLSSLGSTTQDWLGRSQFWASPYFDPYFNGVIDEFRISNTLRYTSNFTVPTTPFSLDGSTVALYHFSEGSGQYTYDASYNSTTNPTAFGYFGVSTSADGNDPSWVFSTLPVTITGFGAQKNDRDVSLSWQAYSTGNGGQFIVERSSDGVGFQTIGNVAVSKYAGTSAYSFIDYSYANGKSYYRLKIIENNTSKYSSVVFVAQSIAFGAYPTVTRDQIFVTIPQPTNVAVYNSAGLLLKKLKLIFSQTIDVSNLSRGEYYLQFESSKQTIRFTKL